METAPPVVLADSSADPASGAAVASKASTQPPASDRNPEYPTITVQRHDTLWALADRHLGDGARYTEILELNRGRPQPDGRRLENPSWLYPGWVLRLPADARITRTGQASGDPEVVVVEQGDTLWEIAEDELGAGTRYPEIFRENVGEPQPDGQRLTDPDVILVGWELDIPGTAAEGTPAESRPAQSAGDVMPTPDAADGQRGTSDQPDPTPETELASPPESPLPDVEPDAATPQAEQADTSAQPEGRSNRTNSMNSMSLTRRHRRVGSSHSGSVGSHWQASWAKWADVACTSSGCAGRGSGSPCRRGTLLTWRPKPERCQTYLARN